MGEGRTGHARVFILSPFCVVLSITFWAHSREGVAFGFRSPRTTGVRKTKRIQKPFRMADPALEMTMGRDRSIDYIFCQAAVVAASEKASQEAGWSGSAGRKRPYVFVFWPLQRSFGPS